MRSQIERKQRMPKIKNDKFVNSERDFDVLFDASTQSYKLLFIFYSRLNFLSCIIATKEDVLMPP